MAIKDNTLHDQHIFKAMKTMTDVTTMVIKGLLLTMAGRLVYLIVF